MTDEESHNDDVIARIFAPLQLLWSCGVVGWRVGQELKLSYGRGKTPPLSAAPKGSQSQHPELSQYAHHGGGGGGAPAGTDKQDDLHKIQEIYSQRQTRKLIIS